MNIYSIKNEKLGFFNRPIYCETHQEALSYIQNVLMSDADRALYGLKGDLALYFLGSIDFTTGSILPALEVYCISNLEDIFDSVPEDKIPRTEKQIVGKIHELETKLHAMDSFVRNLKFDKKGNMIIDG